jgi:hypothetical protein
MNIHQLLSEQNVSFLQGGEHKNIRHGWLGVDCPWCGSVGKYHLGIHSSNNYSVCWNCGHHRLGDVLMKLTKQPWGVVKEWLESLTSSIGITAEPGHVNKVEVPKGVEPLLWAHRNYLRERGFKSREITKIWGVQGIGIENLKLSWRLWIPITVNGNLVSWTTRAIGNATSKYVSARPEEEVIEHKNVLYGADKAHHTIIVCEGPLDVWAIGPGAVCIFGLNCSRSQFLEIASHPTRVICFDSTDQAQRRAQRLFDELEMKSGTTHKVRLKSGEDPAEACQWEIRELRERFLGNQTVGENQ